MHQKLMGVKNNHLLDLKEDKVLNRVFNLFNFQIKLQVEEKLNLFERELVKIYQRKADNVKETLTFMTHEVQQ